MVLCSSLLLSLTSLFPIALNGIMETIYIKHTPVDLPMHSIRPVNNSVDNIYINRLDFSSSGNNGRVL